MSTGSLVNSICYENVSLATDAYFSALPVSQVVNPNTGITLVTSYVNVSGVWNVQQQSIDTSGNQTLVYSVVAQVPGFPSCYAGSEAFNDGNLIAWALVAVMVIVLFVSMLRKSLYV
jgi:hypothetical protein